MGREKHPWDKLRLCERFQVLVSHCPSQSVPAHLPTSLWQSISNYNNVCLGVKERIWSLSLVLNFEVPDTNDYKLHGCHFCGHLAVDLCSCVCKMVLTRPEKGNRGSCKFVVAFLELCVLTQFAINRQIPPSRFTCPTKFGSSCV